MFNIALPVPDLSTKSIPLPRFFSYKVEAVLKWKRFFLFRRFEKDLFIDLHADPLFP